MRVRAAGLLVTGLMTLGLAACGNGNGSQALSKAGYVAQGNRICLQTNQVVDDSVDSAFPNKGNVPTAEEVQRFADRTLVPQLQREVDQLKKLKPPKDDRDTVKQIIDAGKRAADMISTNGVLIMNKDRSPLTRYHELASRYGLEECGKLSDKLKDAFAGVD
jgi:hypothetical protein